MAVCCSASRCAAMPGWTRKVMLVGQLSKFELWDEARWQQQINDDILGLPGTTGQVHHDYRIFLYK